MMKINEMKKADISMIKMTEDVFSLPNCFSFEMAESFDTDTIAVFPGFCDVHVHFREPGFSYKETMKTGTLSAARADVRRRARCPISRRCQIRKKASKNRPI